MRYRWTASLSSLGTLSLGLLLMLTASGSTSEAPASSFAPPEDTIESQIRKDVFTSLQKNEAAQDYAEWKNSGFTPEDIIENVRALKSAEGWTYLCSSLSLLNAENLALFENAVQNAPEIPCRNEILERLNSYWTASQVALSQERTLDRMGKGLNPEGIVSGDTPTELPLMEKHIDAAAGLTYSRGELKDGEIAFTFDDGPHPTRSKRAMEILDNAGIRATFFELGGNANAYPSISKMLADNGHTVASHTHRHPQLTKLPIAQAEEEIDRGRREVYAASGVDIPFFRFPYGARNKTLTEMVKAKGMASFLWNMDTLDWKIRNPSALFQNVLKELDREKGGIILFHDVHEQTILVLPHLIDELRARNFTTVVFVPH